jgi:16S rRNA (cytosine967-C5)-methyltransferase
MASLKQAGCEAEPGLLLRDSWILHGGIPAASEAVRRGRFVIQDEASQAVARILAVKPGNRVLDLCAAPGGKTLILSRDAGAQGSLAAVELHPGRVRAMAERLENAGIRNVTCVALDATKPLPFEQPFDRILVDAPCSGTGTLARHPEIRWRLRPEDLEDLHARQVALLRNALNYLAPHGLLEYSTCSLEPEENEFVVREALSGTDKSFHVVSSADTVKKLLRDNVPADSTTGKDGFFRTFPPVHATDGFFCALIERP